MSQYVSYFLVAMGEEFSEKVCPPVPFNEAPPNECCEAIHLALGDLVTGTTSFTGSTRPRETRRSVSKMV